MNGMDSNSQYGAYRGMKKDKIKNVALSGFLEQVQNCS